MIVMMKNMFSPKAVAEFIANETTSGALYARQAMLKNIEKPGSVSPKKMQSLIDGVIKDMVLLMSMEIQKIEVSSQISFEPSMIYEKPDEIASPDVEPSIDELRPPIEAEPIVKRKRGRPRKVVPVPDVFIDRRQNDRRHTISSPSKDLVVLSV